MVDRRYAPRQRHATGRRDARALRGEAGAKDAGKMRVEGRDYTVRDGDVLLFRFNV